MTNDQAGAALASLGVRPVGMFSGGLMDQNQVSEITTVTTMLSRISAGVFDDVAEPG